MAREARRSSGSRRRNGNSDGGSKQYIGIVGFIPFEPDDDETPDGTPVRRVKVQDGKVMYHCTVWESHDDVVLEAGMLVALQGAFNKNESDDGTVYNNVSASRLFVIGTDEHVRDDQEEGKKSGSAKGRGKTAAKGNRTRSKPEPEDDDDDNEGDGDDDF